MAEGDDAHWRKNHRPHRRCSFKETQCGCTQQEQNPDPVSVEVEGGVASMPATLSIPKTTLFSSATVTAVSTYLRPTKVQQLPAYRLCWWHRAASAGMKPAGAPLPNNCFKSHAVSDVEKLTVVRTSYTTLVYLLTGASSVVNGPSRLRTPPRGGPDPLLSADRKRWEGFCATLEDCEPSALA